MLLDATKEVINHMEVVVDLIEANSDGSSEKLAQKVDEKRKEVNNELSEVGAWSVPIMRRTLKLTEKM